MTELTDKEFCEIYNAFRGESGMLSGIDNPKQLTICNMSGEELKELIEHFLNSKLDPKK